MEEEKKTTIVCTLCDKAIVTQRRHFLSQFGPSTYDVPFIQTVKSGGEFWVQGGIAFEDEQQLPSHHKTITTEHPIPKSLLTFFFSQKSGPSVSI